MKVAQSCPTLCNPMHSPWNSPGQNTEVGSHSLLQGIFPTQQSNPGLLYHRQILYQLSHQGNPGILEWVVYSFSKGFSWPRNLTTVSCIAGGFFTSWATRTPQTLLVSAIIWKNQGTRKEIVTNVGALGISNSLTNLSNIFLIFSGGLQENTGALSSPSF